MLQRIGGILMGVGTIWAVVELVNLSLQDPKIPEDNKEAILICSVIIGGIVALLFAISIALSIVLLVGVYKNELNKVRCWMQINLVFFIVALALGGLGLVLTLLVNPIGAITQLLTIVVDVGITFYLLAVVKSYYTEQMAAFQRMPKNHS